MASWSQIEVPVGEDLKLEGRLMDGGGAAAIVAPPHPEFGGSLDNPVVGALLDGLSTTGRRVVGFNWRGVGHSEGRPTGDPSCATADYLAALEVALEGRECGGALAAGYSFGAGTALGLAAREDRISELLLVAPPTAMLDWTAADALARPLHVIVGDDDVYAPLQATRARVDALGGSLEILGGVDHFFTRGGLLAVRRAAERS